MQEASTEPEKEVQAEEPEGESDKRLDVFKDFVESLDLDDIDSPEGDQED